MRRLLFRSLSFHVWPRDNCFAVFIFFYSNAVAYDATARPINTNDSTKLTPLSLIASVLPATYMPTYLIIFEVVRLYRILK